MSMENKKSIPMVQDRFSGVDREGVEPLERDDESAPGAGRTRPSSTTLLYQNMQHKKKPPCGSSSESVGIDQSGLVTLNTRLHDLKQYVKSNLWITLLTLN